MVTIDFNKIRERAISERWSTYKIAKQCGYMMTPNTVSRILKGTTNPSAVHLKAVCDVIGLPIDQAFLEAETANQKL